MLLLLSYIYLSQNNLQKTFREITFTVYPSCFGNLNTNTPICYTRMHCTNKAKVQSKMPMCCCQSLQKRLFPKDSMNISHERSQALSHPFHNLRRKAQVTSGVKTIHISLFSYSVPGSSWVQWYQQETTEQIREGRSGAMCLRTQILTVTYNFLLSSL